MSKKTETKHFTQRERTGEQKSGEYNRVDKTAHAPQRCYSRIPKHCYTLYYQRRVLYSVLNFCRWNRWITGQKRLEIKGKLWYNINWVNVSSYFETLRVHDLDKEGYECIVFILSMKKNSLDSLFFVLVLPACGVSTVIDLLIMVYEKIRVVD